MTRSFEVSRERSVSPWGRPPPPPSPGKRVITGGTRTDTRKHPPPPTSPFLSFATTQGHYYRVGTAPKEWSSTHFSIYIPILVELCLLYKGRAIFPLAHFSPDLVSRLPVSRKWPQASDSSEPEFGHVVQECIAIAWSAQLRSLECILPRRNSASATETSMVVYNAP